MALIGRVYRDSYEKDGKTIPTLIMDIRTISVRKKFTIAVNKYKYPGGKTDGPVAAGQEREPDYLLWHNFSGRGGDSVPSVTVGSLTDMVGQGGVAYKRGEIFDPFMSPYNVHFALFENTTDGEYLYNAVSDPRDKVQAPPRQDATAGGAHTTVGDRKIPVETEDIRK